MRRRLYIALVLVLLVRTGLAFLRVTASGAYVARMHAKRLEAEIQRAWHMEGGIQYGLARREVLRMMEQAPAETADFDTHISDEWWFENYRLGIAYDPHGVNGRDLMNARAFPVDLTRKSAEARFDRLLEYLGMPHAGPWGVP
jgi:hypothetical protein